MQRQLTLVRQQQARPARRIQPGDKVLIYCALIAQNTWVVIDDVLITGERTKLRSGNMDFYFDDSLVIAHQKGGRK
jgi:predicted RNA-binding protein with PUA-like domain